MIEAKSYMDRRRSTVLDKKQESSQARFIGFKQYDLIIHRDEIQKYQIERFWKIR